MDFSHPLTLLVIWIILGTAGYAGWSAAPWVPSKKRFRKHLASKLPVPPNATVYDLGCGTGTMLLAVLEQHPHATVIGIELSIVPYLIAKFRSLFRKNMHIRYGNLFNADLADADIVFTFLLTRAYPKLIQHFRQTLPDQALVAVAAWPLPDISELTKIQTAQALPTYLYKGRDIKNAILST